MKENIAALAKLGVTTDKSDVDGILPLKGDEKAPKLADILATAQKAVAEKGGNSSSHQNSAENTGELVYVWLKGRSYINDKERVDAGFYKLALPLPDRLAKSPASVVEVFANGISPRKLTEIAKWSGVVHPEDYDDDELLSKIAVADWKPF